MARAKAGGRKEAKKTGGKPGDDSVAPLGFRLFGSIVLPLIVLPECLAQSEAKSCRGRMMEASDGAGRIGGRAASFCPASFRLAGLGL
jgi:hypothetical protein